MYYSSELQKTNVSINDLKLEAVSEFKYLGSKIQSSGKCEKEIGVRIGIAKTAFEKTGRR